MEKIVPVILCGGSGTRLWPLSREKKPKQFLRLLGERSLLQETAVRALNLLDEQSDRLVVVTLDEMAEEAARHLQEIFPANDFYLLPEPEARNTSAAMAYAARFVHERFGPDHHLWVLPADHHIDDLTELKLAVLSALEVSDEEYLVTFGINPTRPESGYGYIRKSRPLNGLGGHLVEQFYEKPDAHLAEKFVGNGYLWNSGMHFFKAKTVKESFLEHAPDTWSGISLAINENLLQPQKDLYARIKKEPFEKAVLEKSNRVAVVPCSLGWSDIGSWQSLWEIHKKDSNGNACSGNIWCEETKNTIVMAQERLVACIGIENAIIIETGDAVLVAGKNCDDGLKNVVNGLRKMKRRETLTHTAQECSWGICRPILESPAIAIRECLIAKNQTYKNTAGKNALNAGLSQWLVAEGRAAFQIDGQTRNLDKDEMISLPSYKTYEIANAGMTDLKLYQIQMNGKGASPLLAMPDRSFAQQGLFKQAAA